MKDVSRGFKPNMIICDDSAVVKSPNVKMREDAPKEIKVYAFEDKYGYIQGYLYTKVFLTDNGDFLSLLGHLMSINSWTICNEPSDSNFMASVSFKWDCCTHWHFYGEDYEEGSETDSYYHLCGTGLPKFIAFMGLVAHIAKSQPNACRDNNLCELDVLNTDKLLEQYNIIEFSGVPSWVEDKVLELKF